LFGKAAAASDWTPAKKILKIKLQAAPDVQRPEWPQSFIFTRERICALLQQQHFKLFASIQADCASLLLSSGV